MKYLKLLFLLVLSLFCFGQELIDGVAAIVGDQIILKSEVEEFAIMNAYQMRINPSQNPEKFARLMQQSLDALINQQILLEQAKIETVEVKDREIEQMLQQQIDAMIQQSGSKEKAEEILGKPLSQIKKDYRSTVEERLIVQRLQAEKFNNITVSRREVENFYQTHKDSLPKVQPSYSFKHILIQIKPGEKEILSARAKADSILSLLRQGADFAELARQYSEDPASAQFGGELGYIERGGFVKEFEQVAFTLDPKEISGVVKTEFGFHIIQLLDRKGETVNVRHILIKIIESKSNFIQARQKARQVHQLLKTGSISFDSAVVKYSDDVKSKINKGFITRMPRNEIENDSFLTVLDTLEENELSSVFETELGFHIIKLVKKNDETWPTIEQWALENKKAKLYQEWMERLRSQFYVEKK